MRLDLPTSNRPSTVRRGYVCRPRSSGGPAVVLVSDSAAEWALSTKSRRNVLIQWAACRT
eukprot:352836-Chlamydomonas_euryale.AAC.6